jgi:hypothetical protein
MLEIIFSRPDRPGWMVAKRLKKMGPMLAQCVLGNWAWRNGIEGHLTIAELTKFIEG